MGEGAVAIAVGIIGRDRGCEPLANSWVAGDGEHGKAVIDEGNGNGRSCYRFTDPLVVDVGGEQADLLTFPGLGNGERSTGGDGAPGDAIG